MQNDETKAAPVGEREAFEAWFFCPSNSLLAEWEDAAREAFQAGADYAALEAERNVLDLLCQERFDELAMLQAENAKLKGEYEWVASINTALDESNQSAWAENAKLRAELERTATWIEELPVPTVGAAGQLVRIDKVLAATPSAPKADERPLYTCIGKGGEYRYLGASIGAGDSRGELAEVYQDRTGQLFHRTPEDFMERMEPIAAARQEESCKR